MFCCALSVLLPKNANTRGSNKGDAPLLSVLHYCSLSQKHHFGFIAQPRWVRGYLWGTNQTKC